MLFGAGATLCIVLLAGLMAALFSDNRPVNLDRRPTEELPAEVSTQPAALAPRARFVAAEYADLDGWSGHATGEILVSWRRSCWRLLEQPLDTAMGPPLPGAATSDPNLGSAGTVADWAGICQAVADLSDDHTAVQAFFAEHFTPVAVIASGADPADAAFGLFTGYYEPTLRGARERSDQYSVPLYAPPEDLLAVNLGSFDPSLRGQRIVGRVEPRDGPDALVPFDARDEIDAGSLAGRADVLFWVEDTLDAFILHIQGSGRIELPDGTQTRAGFAAHNGRPYGSVGRWLIEQGEVEPHGGSFDDIRQWMVEHPDRAQDLLAINPRFVFFREVPGDGPIGAAGVPLTARRSLAIDPRIVPLNVPIWLDADSVGTADAGERLQRLMMAQDTGGAIKGVVRGDFYWGAGDGARRMANRTSTRGKYYILLPHEIAARLIAASAEAELAN